MAQIWDLWYPKAAATGLSFARGRIDKATIMLVHAAPPFLTVTVRDDNGLTIAEGKDLAATDESPITRLTLHGSTIAREDIWPTEGDLGQLVILPGGEVGTLKQWWHATDHTEWRWQIEFYNHR
ncbi:MAG: hypothetical protein ABI947_02385 [Chloroflexota bacterium]